MQNVRILIVGTGNMAKSHIEAYADIPNVRIVGAVDTNEDRLRTFCKTHDISQRFTDIADALGWGEFDAVSNVTPDAAHFATTMPFLTAGKHVLCEKPLATNARDARIMTDAAAKAGVVNMVNLTYRNVPALVHAEHMVRLGQIGVVRHFEASYLQSWLTQPAWGDWREEEQWLWRLSTTHGSLGVLGDVGVHILDFATFVAGSNAASVSCRLTTFDKAPGGQVGAYVLDANDSMNMHLALDNGAVGVIHASRMASGHINDLNLRIFGTLGGMEVQFVNGKGRLRVSIGEDMLTGHWVDVEPPAVDTNHARFVRAIVEGATVFPDFARGAALQNVLDLAVASDADGSRSLSS